MKRLKRVLFAVALFVGLVSMTNADKWTTVCERYEAFTGISYTVLSQGSTIKLRSQDANGKVTYDSIDVITAINICNIK